MNNMKHKILSLLVLLLTAATGAWAQETATITLTSGQTVKTYEDVTLPWSTTAEILKAVVTDINFNINIDAISGGDGKVVKYGNENFTVTGTFSGNATVVVSYNMGSSATITVTAPGPLLTLNEAKTEATFAMPAFDATAEYELVRDMSVQMTAQVGDGTQEQPRYRVKKDGNKFIPADMEMAAVPALFTVNDAIEQKALTQTQDFYVKIFKIDEQTFEPISTDGVEFADFDFAPGLYAVKAVAATGSDYDGETALSNTFKLFQGYEIVVPAGEFATFYKDENIYEADDDAELYTISSVSEDKVMLSDVRDLIPANTAMLVYNKSTEEKTFLLIPTEDEPVSFMSYGGFKGTLTGTTIAASSASQNNYALNGTAFVWVKNSIAVGANKCWLEVPTGVLTARRLTITFGDGNTTGIDAIGQFDDLQSDNWYDLNGRKLNAKPTKKGVYIQNGQKVVIK